MAIERNFPAGALQPLPETPVEIEVIQQQMSMGMPTDDGGMVIDLYPEEAKKEVSHDSNLAEFIDDNELMAVAIELVAAYESDKQSRSEWEKTYIEGLDLLGLKFEDRDKPWAGACGVFHPMLAEAVVRFQAQTIQEIFPASGPVKTKIVGDTSIERVQQANRGGGR